MFVMATVYRDQFNTVVRDLPDHFNFKWHETNRRNGRMTERMEEKDYDWENEEHIANKDIMYETQFQFLLDDGMEREEAYKTICEAKSDGKCHPIHVWLPVDRVATEVIHRIVHTVSS